MTPATRLIPLALAASFALSGCMPMGPMAGTAANEIVNPVVANPTPAAAALQERKPDLCKASAYAGQVGQPASVIGSLGVSGSYRVVEPGGIEPQTYDPNRIVFRVDGAGRISAVDCG